MRLGIVADRMLELLNSDVDPECLETLDPELVEPCAETRSLSTLHAVAVAVGRIVEPGDLKWEIAYGYDRDSGKIGIYLHTRGVYYLVAV